MHVRSSAIFVCFLVTCLILAGAVKGQQAPELPEARIAVSRDTAAITELIKAGVRRKQTDRDSAILLLREGLELSRMTKYSYGIATATFHLGAIYAGMGLFPESLDMLNESVVHTIRSPRKMQWLPYLYGNIASVYFFLGDYEAAALFSYQALPFMENLPTSNQAINIYSNLGATLMNLPDAYQEGFRERAWYYLEHARRNAGTHKELLSGAYVNKAEYFSKLGMHDTAHVFLDSALAVIRGENLPDIEVCVYVTKGEILLRQQRPQEALKFLYAAYRVPKANPYYTVMTEKDLGTAYSVMGEYSEAEKWLLKAMKGAQTSGMNFCLLEINRTLADIYQTTGQHREALEHYQAYTELKDRIVGRDAVNSISRLEVKYNIAQKDRELFHNQLLISKQAQKLQRTQMLVGGIAAGMLVLVLTFTVVHRNNKHKQRMQAKQIRILEQEQQILVNEQEIVQLKAMIRGEEQERARIAQELHDGIGGMLAAAKMNLSPLRTNISPEGEKGLNTVAKILSDTSEEVRKTAQNLMPHVLFRQNLQKALETYCESISNKGGLTIALQFHGYTPLPDKSMELMIYRMVQELIQNIIKHAGATRAEIQIMQYDGRLHVTVEDNGKGFDTGKEYDGIGLQNLRNRANTLRGFLSITSTPNKGTTVHMEFDIEKLT